ncbi:MAG TPA: hypothetical protein VFI08_01635 [Spirochaetia bacterium]|nr:hypothetical protein [Spirochaetia bacterium]
MTNQIVCYGCRLSLEHNDHMRRLTRACESCFNDLMTSRKAEIPQYLDALSHPAALVTPNNTVLVANKGFHSLQMDKTVVGRQVGDVLECMYAPLLGRCGETVACILCALRRAVESTWSTGEGLRDVPVSYPHRVAARKTMNVTTERVADAVLVILESTSEGLSI